MRNVLLACLVFTGWNLAAAEPPSTIPQNHKTMLAPPIPRPVLRAPTTPLKTIVQHRLKYADAKKVAIEIDSALCRKHQIERTQCGSVVESKLVIVPDPVTNSLIVVAAPELADEIRQLIEKADRPPKQYVVEAKIIEISPDGKQAIKAAPTLMTIAGQPASLSIQQADGLTLELELTVEKRPASWSALYDSSHQDQPETSAVPPHPLSVRPRNPHMSTAGILKEHDILRKEQRFAALVDQYNVCFHQQQFAEAEVLAKQAAELDPKNPVALCMKWKARFARRVNAIEKGKPQQIGLLPCGDEIAEPEKLRIETGLLKRVSLDFKDVPLSEVMAHLAAAADVNIVLDTLGLEEVGVLPSAKVTITVDGIMLKSALNLVLKPLHLAYVIEDEVLKITSRQRRLGELEVRTYSVCDLVTGPEAGNDDKRIIDFDVLYDLISTTVEPDSWEEVGGPGSIRAFEPTCSLVVRQTQQVHEEITELLQQIRRLPPVRGEEEKEELLGISVAPQQPEPAKPIEKNLPFD